MMPKITLLSVNGLAPVSWVCCAAAVVQVSAEDQPQGRHVWLWAGCCFSQYLSRFPIMFHRLLACVSPRFHASLRV